jgi:hypothetical protein
MNALESMPIVFLGFSSIAAMTWFFSSNPRLYLRLFVPRDELMGVGRWVFRHKKEYRHGLRLMAHLQLLVGCIIELISLLLQK